MNKMNEHEKLFPSLATKEMEKKPYIITVHRTYSSKKIGYKIIDSQTEKMIKQELDEINIDDFLKNTSFKNVKVVIFNISDFNRECSDIDYDVKTREKASTILRTMKVPHLFVNDKTYAAMTALMYARVVPKVGERILAITVVMEDLAVIELIREHRGYKIVERRDIKCSVDDTNLKQLQTDILGKNIPSKIIIMSLLPLLVNGGVMDKLKNHILKGKSLIISEDEHVLTVKMEDNLSKNACYVARNLYDQTFTTYHIIPSCHATYCLSKSRHFNNSRGAVIAYIDKYQTLPILNHLSSIERTDEPFYIFCFDNKKKCYMHVKTVQFNPYKSAICNRMQLYFYVDENDIPYLYHYSMTEGEFMSIRSEVPVIAFFRNLSYIRVKNENSLNDYKYDFLDIWSDKFGKETFLSFEEETPKVVSKIDDNCNAKRVIKVQDIIQVMSMLSENITIDPKWNFEIRNTSENPILITFENFDGMSSSASPAFLMALIFKHFLKLIRESTKVKPEQIGVYLIDEIYDSEAKERIENGFEEACKLLKVEYFSSEELCKTCSVSPISLV